jgi:hypothetical protein
MCGHQSPGTMKNWRDAGAKIYRTDENSTIIALSDGLDVMISAKAPSEKTDGGAPADNGALADNDAPLEYPPNRPEASGTDAGATSEWVLNTNTKKIHYPECRAVPQISPVNYAVSDKTVAELLNEGFAACGICKPHD